MSLRAIFFITLYTVLTHSLVAQRPIDYANQGQVALDEGKLEEAFGYFRQAFIMDSADFDFTVLYAESAEQMKYFRLAEHLYDKLYQKDKGKLYKPGLHRLASMQRSNGKYEDAYRNLRKAIKKEKDETSDEYLDMQFQLDACEWAINYRPPKDTIPLTHLDENINSEESEIAPAHFNKQFLFASTRDLAHAWKLYQGKITGDNIETIESFKSLLDDDYEQANLCVAPDGKHGFISRRKTDETFTHLYSFEIINGEFKNPQPVDALNVEEYTSTMPHAAVLNGKQVLFYATDRPGGQGGMDIWMSERNGNSFSAPTNLDATINTRGDELTPFFHDNKLYFSSNGHFGFGGLDIYASEIKEGKFFYNAENLGVPFNTSRNDLYCALYPEIKKGFLASNREGSIAGEMHDEACCNDLYSFTIEAEKKEELPFADLDELNRYLPVTLYFHNDEPNPDSWDTTTTLTYIQAYNSYKKLVPTYLSENTKGLNGEEREEAEITTEDFFRLQVDKGVNDLGVFCKLLRKELEQGKKLQLSVRGFASPRAKTDYNVNLTKRRITSLINYLSEYEKGELKKYINDTSPNGGRLRFVQLPFGEYQADKTVSDDLLNEKQSIYNRGASLERKIEIQSVTYLPEEPRAVLGVDKSVHDFGTIKSTGVKQHTFVISNNGNASMTIDSLEVSCGCTATELEKYLLKPGESTALRVTFNPEGQRGQQVKTITIHVHGEEPYVLTLMGEVE